jgi:hypothetical protein
MKNSEIRGGENMELLLSHWHCVLPLIGLAAYLICAARN